MNTLSFKTAGVVGTPHQSEHTQPGPSFPVCVSIPAPSQVAGLKPSVTATHRVMLPTAKSGNSAKAKIPATRRQWRLDIHSNPRSCTRLHPAPPLPLPQSPLQALSSTMPLWEPEYSENAELFL